MDPLYKYRANAYSQHGEDGIVLEILLRLGDAAGKPADMWVVDVGAWDGKHLSNCFNIITWGASGVFIEGDSAKYEDLLKTVAEYSRIVPINAYVDQFNTDPNSLDQLLSRTPIPKDFTLLSIDIDSYDSDVWETLENYTPKIVIIETNSNAGPLTKWRHIEPHPGEISRGTSYAEMLDVAEKKGYSIVAYTGNCIFVRNDLYHLIGNDIMKHDMFFTMNKYN